MKKNLLLLSFLAATAGINLSSAQTPVLYGTCYNGGTSNWGAIFQADLDGSNLQTVYSFLNPEGAMPWGKIAQAANGKIYGVTFLGGCIDSCTLYEYDPIAGTCIDVHDFFCNTPVISEPSQGGLIYLSDGNLYGLEQAGLIYKFNPNTHVYTLLQQTAGAGYYGGLMQASDGALYGCSYSGGANNQGFIFRFDLTTLTYSNIYSFDGAHGGHSYYGYLIQGTDGKLYGTTFDGGANNYGVVFSYDLTSNVYSDLHDFELNYGATPYSGVMQATNGILYGMTNSGGTNNQGVIFSYDITTNQYSVLQNFDGTNGANPYGTLTQSSTGKLFGTTYVGGTNSNGVAFSYDIASGAYTVLANFIMASGAHPMCDIQEAVVEFPTGLAAASASSFSIYVHASTQQLVIETPLMKDAAGLVMFDAVGKTVLQSLIHQQKSVFDLSSYPRGIYFVKVLNGLNSVVRKVVKM
jgi:uncharacterized repeat protein (TIGR03803 family)